MLFSVPGGRRAIVVYKARQGSREPLEPLEPCGLDSTIERGAAGWDVTGRLGADEDATKPSRNRRSIKFKLCSLEYTSRRALVLWYGLLEREALAVVE